MTPSIAFSPQLEISTGRPAANTQCRATEVPGANKETAGTIPEARNGASASSRASPRAQTGKIKNACNNLPEPVRLGFRSVGCDVGVEHLLAGRPRSHYASTTSPWTVADVSAEMLADGRQRALPAPFRSLWIKEAPKLESYQALEKVAPGSLGFHGLKVGSARRAY